MGLERLTTVMQGKLSNFDNDLFSPIIQAAADAAGVHYGKDAQSDWSLKGHRRPSARRLLPHRRRHHAWHEGRGYVLRRILRRAVRHGRVLGIRKTFLPSLFPSVEGIFEGTYPELSKRRDVIVQRPARRRRALQPHAGYGN